MRALKNKKRITRNTEFIVNYTRNVISEAEQVLSVDLFHDQPISLCASKKKIRNLFEKIRNKFEDSEYLLVTNLENQTPRHKMLFCIDWPASKFQKILEKAWKNCTVELVTKEKAEKYAQTFGDFYLDAAESLPFSNQNSRQVKPKLFQRSQIK